MAEYRNNAVQSVSLNSPIIFANSIPCVCGYIYHEDETGTFILRGATPGCYVRYNVEFNGNIAVPTGGTAGAIAVAITINGEPRLTSRAIVTPAAVGEYFNVTSVAVITVPKGCCFQLSVDAVPASEDATFTPAPVISVQNANLTINQAR